MFLPRGKHRIFRKVAVSSKKLNQVAKLLGISAKRKAKLTSGPLYISQRVRPAKASRRKRRSGGSRSR
jgi:hypothetical protein